MLCRHQYIVSYYYYFINNPCKIPGTKMLPSLPPCSQTSYLHSNLMFRKFSGRSWRATFSHSSSCLANFRITWVKLEREMTHARCLVCCPVLPTGPYRVLFPLMVFWLQPLGATESSNSGTGSAVHALWRAGGSEKGVDRMCSGAHAGRQGRHSIHRCGEKPTAMPGIIQNPVCE